MSQNPVRDAVVGEGPVIETTYHRASRGREARRELKHSLRYLDGITDDLIDTLDAVTVQDRDPDEHGDPGQRGGADPTAPFTEPIGIALSAINDAKNALDEVLDLANDLSRTPAPSSGPHFPRPW
jgi:hypothetical protein